MNTSLESGGSGCGSGGSGENSGGGGNSLSRYLKLIRPHQEKIQCNGLIWKLESVKLSLNSVKSTLVGDWFRPVSL